MSTVPTAVRAGSSAPAATTPASCSRFSWCTKTTLGHTEHFSSSVPIVDDADRFVFAETDEAGLLLYGPVLGSVASDDPVGHGRAVAEELRAAAARIEALVARVELAGGAA